MGLVALWHAESSQTKDQTWLSCIDKWIFFLMNLFLIGGELLYNVVLVSAIHEHESTVSIYIWKADS